VSELRSPDKSAPSRTEGGWRKGHIRLLKVGKEIELKNLLAVIEGQRKLSRFTASHEIRPPEKIEKSKDELTSRGISKQKTPKLHITENLKEGEEKGGKTTLEHARGFVFSSVQDLGRKGHYKPLLS